ncbi:MAG: hypothetical protein R3B70_15665 [Polyangiaceae bacterium]
MRISLAGGGTDVPPLAPGIGGRVVCAAIDLHVRATVEPFDRGWVRLEGSWGLAETEAEAATDPDSPAFADSADSLDHAPTPVSERISVLPVVPVAGVRPGSPPRAATLTRRAGELPSTDPAFRMLEAVRQSFGIEGGVRIAIESDLTFGTGLGGSAAAAVALVAAFHGAIGEPASTHHLATAANYLERDILGLRCGMQDPLCASAGGFLDLRFFDAPNLPDNGPSTATLPFAPTATLADATAISVPGPVGFELDTITLSPSLARELSAGLLLVDTRVRRVSGEVLDIANDGRARPFSADLVAAADDTARGFRLGSLPLVLAGMRRSASAKLRRGGAGSLPRDWVQLLIDRGAVVVRACGAGRGGHVLVWADPSCHPDIERAVAPALVRRPSLGVPGVELLTA